MNASSQKGDRRERQLIITADEQQFGAMRCPASGSATSRQLPDVIISREATEITEHSPLAHPLSRAWSIEVKGDKNGTPNLPHAEIEGLCAHALAWGSTPLVAVHPNRGEWSFFEPSELKINDKSRSVTQDMLPGPTFEEVFVNG